MNASRIALIVIWTAVAVPSFAQVEKPKYAEGYAYSAGTSKGSGGWHSLGPSDTWWRNQSYVTMLSLTPDQQKRMDDALQQSRIKLIDLKAALDKEELILEPLLETDRLDEIKVAAQIDKVADARAELEKGNARMLLGIRQVLTPEQWKTLNSSKLSDYYSALSGNKGKAIDEKLKLKQDKK